MNFDLSLNNILSAQFFWEKNRFCLMKDAKMKSFVGTQKLRSISENGLLKLFYAIWQVKIFDIQSHEINDQLKQKQFI